MDSIGSRATALFGLAAIPDRASTRLIAAGMLLFLMAPVLCVIAVFTDYWI